MSRVPLDRIELHSGFTFVYDFAYTSASQKKHTAISLEFVPPTKDQDFFVLPDIAFSYNGRAFWPFKSFAGHWRCAIFRIFRLPLIDFISFLELPALPSRPELLNWEQREQFLKHCLRLRGASKTRRPIEDIFPLSPEVLKFTEKWCTAPSITFGIRVPNAWHPVTWAGKIMMGQIFGSVCIFCLPLPYKVQPRQALTS